MKNLTLTLLALVAMASCSKENSTATIEEPVAATFTAAAITRVANNAWETDDKIGVSMTVSGSTTLAEGDYLNVPHTVYEAGVSSDFNADSQVITFPTDGSSVDFYAYYPYGTLDSNNDLAVSVANQEFSDIDVIAAKVSAKTKASPTVSFSGDDAFAHCLSKLSIVFVAGSGITSLAGMTTTIKGQYTTANYNIFTNAISGMGGNTTDITAITATDGSSAEAILLPTAGAAGSTIVFTHSGRDYVWDTSAVELVQGNEHIYTITVTQTTFAIDGATISNWGSGTGGTGTAE